MQKFQWVPSPGMEVSAQPITKVVSFGDGYEQRAPAGINNDLRTYTVSFTPREQTTANEINDFLTRHGGIHAFEWQPPKLKKSGLFVCESWSMNVVNRTSTINATFREVIA